MFGSIRRRTMIQKLFRGLFAAACFSLLLTGLLCAQSPQATISGIITDTTGAIVPGVQVTALGVATGQRITVTSNGEGFFVLTQLPIGDYTIEAEKTGFRKYVRQALTLTTGATVALDIQLEVGQASETVTVTGEA